MAPVMRVRGFAAVCGRNAGLPSERGAAASPGWGPCRPGRGPICGTGQFTRGRPGDTVQRVEAGGSPNVDASDGWTSGGPRRERGHFAPNLSFLWFLRGRRSHHLRCSAITRCAITTCESNCDSKVNSETHRASVIASKIASLRSRVTIRLRRSFETTRNTAANTAFIHQA